MERLTMRRRLEVNKHGAADRYDSTLILRAAKVKLPMAARRVENVAPNDPL